MPGGARQAGHRSERRTSVPTPPVCLSSFCIVRNVKAVQAVRTARDSGCLDGISSSPLVIDGDNIHAAVEFIRLGGVLVLPEEFASSVPTGVAVSFSGSLSNLETGFLTAPNPPEQVLSFARCAGDFRQAGRFRGGTGRRG